MITLEHAPGEEKRVEELKKALDGRFSTPKKADLLFDYRFTSDDPTLVELFGQPACLNLEVKDFTEGSSDYLGSILNGHLFEQITRAQESGLPFVLAALGDDRDLDAAIIRSVMKRGFKGDEAAFRITNLQGRIDHFENECEGLGIRTWWIRRTPWKRILSRVEKIFTGGSILDYRLRPADGERWIAATCIAFDGIGPEKGGTIMEYFRWGLIPRRPELGLEPGDLPGIGPKLDQEIRGRLRA